MQRFELEDTGRVKEQAKQLYNEPENHRIAYCAALTEAGGYCQDTRHIEIIKFLLRRCCMRASTRRD